MTTPTELARRLLVVDDNLAIHDDFRKIFARPDAAVAELDALEDALFDAPATPRVSAAVFEVETAPQGEVGLARVVAALAEQRPYAVAFVDMRMPPGWDGLETIERMWQVDPDLQVVICSAFSDYSWDDVRARLGERDGLLIIKKPFDPIEVVQCVHAMSTKWRLAREAKVLVEGLEVAVRVRTAELETSNRKLTQEKHDREQLEGELRLAQRLEAIGQLASGVAHEINTPIQFVGDSLHFVSEGVSELVRLATEFRAAADDPALTARFDQLAEAIDLVYLAEQMPQAIARMQDGVARVATIVRSMKELAHPGPRDLAPVDINRALHNALQVTANNYKYVADVVETLDEVPAVVGYPGDLGQVFLNIIVNAAHAMEDCEQRTGARGRLSIGTRVDGADVVISIGDTGTGIADVHRAHIFEAFFTTKAVGRGTGQGLAISRKIVVDRHGGTLTFDSTLGVGTTFHIRLPICGPKLEVSERLRALA